MIGVLGITGPAWYQGFLEWLPDGKLFSIRAVFDALPSIIERPAAVFAITAFAFNEAAYMSESIRAAIQAVSPGEIEAARSLGMTSGQVYRRIIIPNAAVIATPSLINTLIGLTKGTSLAFSAGIVEVYAQAQIQGGADYRYFERYISVSLVYWALSVLIESFGRFLENKMAIQAPESVDISGVGGDR
ncbi:amino acid ABC transporter permease [Streptococcus suis]|uniref:amino acid ABC transporter permease n=1 Tax=Streptococcus suis TaxID=1307 RepID=UPI003756E61E